MVLRPSSANRTIMQECHLITRARLFKTYAQIYHAHVSFSRKCIQCVKLNLNHLRKGHEAKIKIHKIEKRMKIDLKTDGDVACKVTQAYDR